MNQFTDLCFRLWNLEKELLSTFPNYLKKETLFSDKRLVGRKIKRFKMKCCFWDLDDMWYISLPDGWLLRCFLLTLDEILQEFWARQISCFSQVRALTWNTWKLDVCGKKNISLMILLSGSISFSSAASGTSISWYPPPFASLSIISTRKIW